MGVGWFFSLCLGFFFKDIICTPLTDFKRSCIQQVRLPFCYIIHLLTREDFLHLPKTLNIILIDR